MTLTKQTSYPIKISASIVVSLVCLSFTAFITLRMFLHQPLQLGHGPGAKGQNRWGFKQKVTTHISRYFMPFSSGNRADTRRPQRHDTIF